MVISIYQLSNGWSHLWHCSRQEQKDQETWLAAHVECSAEQWLPVTWSAPACSVGTSCSSLGLCTLKSWFCALVWTCLCDLLMSALSSTRDIQMLPEKLKTRQSLYFLPKLLLLFSALLLFGNLVSWKKIILTSYTSFWFFFTAICCRDLSCVSGWIFLRLASVLSGIKLDWGRVQSLTNLIFESFCSQLSSDISAWCGNVLHGGPYEECVLNPVKPSRFWSLQSLGFSQQCSIPVLNQALCMAGGSLAVYPGPHLLCGSRGRCWSPWGTQKGPQPCSPKPHRSPQSLLRSWWFGKDVGGKTGPVPWCGGSKGLCCRLRGLPAAPSWGAPHLQHNTDTLLHARQVAANT